MEEIIYALGHSNYNLEKFINLINKYNINCIVDIRGTPYSKYNIQYNRENLRKYLKEKNLIYVYMGKEFAVQRNNKNLYNDEGFADFNKVIYDKDFLKGIERIKTGMNKGFRICILGAKQNPIDCHRYILVGRYLYNKGINIKYILDDGTLKDHKALEEVLIEKFFQNKNQLSIDELLLGEKYREYILNKSYELSNEIIGKRLE